jgi:hypothetical protein
MSSTQSFKTYLADHPRMIGALFAITMLLSQAGSVAASGAQAQPGP